MLFNGPAGQVAVESLTSVSAPPCALTRLVFVFQQGLLVPELSTAEENVSLAAMIAGVPRQRARSISADLFEPVWVWGRCWTAVWVNVRWSGSACGDCPLPVDGAPVTFADEPTGAVDSKTARVDGSAADHDFRSRGGLSAGIVVTLTNVAAACGSACGVPEDGQILSDQRNNQAVFPLPRTTLRALALGLQAGASWNTVYALLAKANPMGSQAGLPCWLCRLLGTVLTVCRWCSGAGTLA